MDWTIDFRAIVVATSWFAVAIVLLSLLLVVRVTQQRNAAKQREEQLRRFRAEWEPVLNGAPQHREKLPFVRQADMEEWMLLWNGAQEAAYEAPDGALKRSYLNDLAARKDMASRAMRWTHRGDVVDKLQAITVLGHLRETGAIPVLRPLCDSPDALISLAAARAILQINPPFADRFVAMMAERSDWPVGKVVAIVKQERQTLQTPLLEMCNTAPPAVSRGLIPYLEYLDPAAVLPVVRHLLDTKADPELLTATLRVAHKDGGPAELPFAVKLAAHKDWRVRVQAANVIGALGDASNVDLLTGLLNDRQWWVRYRAAQALGEISARSKIDLTTIAQSREDRFAREALTEVIAERAPLLQGAAVS